MKYDFKLVLSIGMCYDEETDEVFTSGVEITAVDEDGDLIEDISEIKEIRELADNIFKGLEEIEIKVEAE
jgi:hypothetical protein